MDYFKDNIHKGKSQWGSEILEDVTHIVQTVEIFIISEQSSICSDTFSKHCLMNLL